ncbi:MAG: hypothetical protein E6J78_16315 [Deltaproteobacteria bacterium]|nr:MAG: hypothetical protein E6J78_16315 [Deltaproteobacteria bacterium]
MGTLSVIKILGHLKFMSAGLKLPTAKAASGDGFSNKYYKDRDPDSDGSPVAPNQIPIPFLQPQKPGYSHQQKTCNKIGKDFQDFHDAMLDAVQFSHNMWKLQAMFKDLKIMGPSAIGTPGCLSGPPLESNIKNAPMVASFTGNMAKHRDAVAKGVSTCFKNWQDQVMIPGLPLYPLFAAFPGPMAPPTPNIPVPLIACPSAKVSDIITPSAMTQEMDDALDGGLKKKDPEKHYNALHASIAQALSIGFLIWVASQLVTNCLGQGPIPTFAPPYVPVGPVMNGSNIPAPNFMA